MSNPYGYAQLTETQQLGFAIETLRAEYLAQPPKKRAETLDRVRRLLAAEARRGQAQPSWLSLHARKIYGRDL